MFCPRCGAQNKLEQKFCRNCGQSLPAVKLALEGKVDEAASTIAKDFNTLAGGILTLIIFALIALVSTFFSGFNAGLNLILGLLIAGPIIYKGIKRLERSIKLIDVKTKIQEPEPNKTTTEAVENTMLPPVPETDPLAVSQIPSTVTEHTTLNLKPPEHRG